VGPRSGLDAVENEKSFTVGNRTRVVHSVTRRCNEYISKVVTVSSFLFLDVSCNYSFVKAIGQEGKCWQSMKSALPVLRVQFSSSSSSS
jgi:hypothetical protein